jgi:hypothetical protein
MGAKEIRLKWNAPKQVGMLTQAMEWLEAKQSPQSQSSGDGTPAEPAETTTSTPSTVDNGQKNKEAAETESGGNVEVPRKSAEGTAPAANQARRKAPDIAFTARERWLAGPTRRQAKKVTRHLEKAAAAHTTMLKALDRVLTEDEGERNKGLIPETEMWDVSIPWPRRTRARSPERVYTPVVPTEDTSKGNVKVPRAPKKKVAATIQLSAPHAPTVDDPRVPERLKSLRRLLRQYTTTVPNVRYIAELVKGMGQATTRECRKELTMIKSYLRRLGRVNFSLRVTENHRQDAPSWMTWNRGLNEWYEYQVSEPFKLEYPQLVYKQMVLESSEQGSRTGQLHALIEEKRLLYEALYVVIGRLKSEKGMKMVENREAVRKVLDRVTQAPLVDGPIQYNHPLTGKFTRSYISKAAENEELAGLLSIEQLRTM